MNKKLPKEYKESFFNKIIINIKKILFRNKMKNEVVYSNIEDIGEEKNKNNNMLENLKVNVEFNYNNEYEKKKFMKNLSENPKLLENFSNERLKKILQWYEDENDKKRAILRKLNA